MPTLRRPIDTNVLLRVTEAFAEGSFETLFDTEWPTVEGFIRAANDYVPKDSRSRFAIAVEDALEASKMVRFSTEWR